MAIILTVVKAVEGSQVQEDYLITDQPLIGCRIRFVDLRHCW